MSYARKVGGFIFVCILAVAPFVVAPSVYATGESYRYDPDDQSLRANNGSYLSAFGLTGDAIFHYDGSGDYAASSGMEVHYFEKSANILGNNCNNGIAYVEAHVDTKNKRITQVINGCGLYSEGGTTQIKAGLYWDQPVGYTTISTGGGGGSTNISGTPTYEFNVTDSTDGLSIKACGGFYKQFNSAGCVKYSLVGDTGTVTYVGNYDSSLYYKATESVPKGGKACEINMYIAISDAQREVTSASLPGYAAYALSISGTSVTARPDLISSGCDFIQPSNHSTYIKSPGLGITITGADKINSINGEPVAKDADVVSTCGVDEVGWAVCPLLNFIGKLNDMAFATLSGTFLETPSSLINDADTLAAWRNFRDIANALFIIAFLFMVYSQMAGGRGKDR